MSKQANLTFIGAFVVGAVSLIVMALLVFGSGRIFSDTARYVVYFSGSVKGLRVGAPVNFRGARMGSVVDVSIVFNEDTEAVLIPVVIEVRRDYIKRAGSKINDSDVVVDYDQRVKRLIERGLKAQLALESLVTGQLYVQIDFHPDSPIRYVGGQSKYMEIPSVTSSMEEFAETIEKLPLEDIFQKVQDAIIGIESFVNSPELKRAVVTLDKFLQDGDRLINNLDNDLPGLVADLRKVSDETKGTLRQATKTFASIEGLTAEDAEFHYKLQ